MFQMVSLTEVKQDFLMDLRCALVSIRTYKGREGERERLGEKETERKRCIMYIT